MKSKSCTAGAFALLLMLATGCSPATRPSILQTPIVVTEAASAADVCAVWRPVTYSSRDTPETQTEVRAGNAARDAYCREG